ncbi:MAG TPA: hypothetical protein VK035_02550 [Kiloniellales bacterium]|nr:hypothetical protein [Kiloniellales bacterium]
MTESLFVALFVVLPLAAALLFLVYRARYFLRNMLIVGVLAFGVWGLLKLASTDFGLFERQEAESPLYQPASCFKPQRGVVSSPLECAL